jgi:hypothetical protein
VGGNLFSTGLAGVFFPPFCVLQDMLFNQLLLTAIQLHDLEEQLAANLFNAILPPSA